MCILYCRLPCSFVTQALLGSYATQSQVGDYDVEQHGCGLDYIKKVHYVKGQNDELLEKISELHKTQRYI